MRSLCRKLVWGKSGSGPNEKKSECSETVRKTDLVQKGFYFCFLLLLCVKFLCNRITSCTTHEFISKSPQSSQQKSTQKNVIEIFAFCPWHYKNWLYWVCNKLTTYLRYFYQNNDSSLFILFKTKDKIDFYPCVRYYALVKLIGAPPQLIN